MGIKDIVKDVEHAAGEMIKEVEEATDDLIVPKHDHEIAEEVKADM